MSLMVPGEVGTLFMVLTGDQWPSADEDQLFLLADAWDRAAGRLGSELGPELAEAVNKIRREFRGKAALRFADRMAPYVVEPPYYVDTATQRFKALAALLRQTALQVQYVKYVSILSLIELLAEIAWAVAMAGPTFGGSMAWLSARIAVVRFLLERWWGQLLMRILQAQIVGIALQVGIDVAAQGLQFLTDPHKTSWDTKATVTSVEIGALGGALTLPLSAFSGLLGNALGRTLVKHLGNDIDPKILENAARNAAERHAHEFPTTSMAAFADAVGKSIDNYAGMSVRGMWADKGAKGFAEILEESLHEYLTEGMYNLMTGKPNPFGNPFGLTAGLASGLSSQLGSLLGAAKTGNLRPPPGPAGTGADHGTGTDNPPGSPSGGPGASGPAGSAPPGSQPGSGTGGDPNLNGFNGFNPGLNGPGTSVNGPGLPPPVVVTPPGTSTKSAAPVPTAPVTAVPSPGTPLPPSAPKAAPQTAVTSPATSGTPAAVTPAGGPPTTSAPAPPGTNVAPAAAPPATGAPATGAAAGGTAPSAANGPAVTPPSGIATQSPPVPAAPTGTPTPQPGATTPSAPQTPAGSGPDQSVAASGTAPQAATSPATVPSTPQPNAPSPAGSAAPSATPSSPAPTATATPTPATATATPTATTTPTATATPTATPTPAAATTTATPATPTAATATATPTTAAATVPPATASTTVPAATVPTATAPGAAVAAAGSQAAAGPATGSPGSPVPSTVSPASAAPSPSPSPVAAGGGRGPASLPAAVTDGASVVRLPAGGRPVPGGSVSGIVKQVAPGSTSVVLMSEGNAGNGVVIPPRDAARLASDLGKDVVAFVPGSGGRGPRWMTFPANGGRPRPVRTGPGAQHPVTVAQVGTTANAGTPGGTTTSPTATTPTGPGPTTASVTPSVRTASGPATSGPVSTVLTTSGPATTVPVTSDPATTVPGTSGPATTDPATTVPGTSGPATSGPATATPTPEATGTAPDPAGPPRSAPAPGSPGAVVPGPVVPGVVALPGGRGHQLGPVHDPVLAGLVEHLPADASADTFIAFGSSAGLSGGGVRLSGPEAGGVIASTRTPGDTRPLRLVACDSAVGGLDSPAAHAALATGAPALGADGWVWQPKGGGPVQAGVVSHPVHAPDGTTRPAMPPTGNWVLFVPHPDGTVTSVPLGPHLPANLAAEVAKVTGQAAAGQPGPRPHSGAGPQAAPKPGHDAGYDSGYESGHDSGYDSGHDSERGSGPDSGPPADPYHAGKVSWVHFAGGAPVDTTRLGNGQVALLLGGPLRPAGLTTTDGVRDAIAQQLAQRAGLPADEAAAVAAGVSHDVVLGALPAIVNGGHRITLQTSRGTREVVLGGQLGPRQSATPGPRGPDRGRNLEVRRFEVAPVEQSKSSSGKSSVSAAVSFSPFIPLGATPPLMNAGGGAGFTFTESQVDTSARFGDRAYPNIADFAKDGQEVRGVQFSVDVDGGPARPAGTNNPVAVGDGLRADVLIDLPAGVSLGGTATRTDPATPFAFYGKVHQAQVSPAFVNNLATTLPAGTRTPGSDQRADLLDFLGGIGGRAAEVFGGGALSPLLGKTAFVLQGTGTATYLGSGPGRPETWQWTNLGATTSTSHGSGASVNAGVNAGARYLTDPSNSSPFGQFTLGGTVTTSSSTREGASSDRQVETLHISSTRSDAYFYAVDVALTVPGHTPGQNQPGQNQPGQNQPGQNQPGQNQPGQNQPGQNPAGGPPPPGATLLVSMAPHDAIRLGYPVPAGATTVAGPPTVPAPPTAAGGSTVPGPTEPSPSLVGQLGVLGDAQVRDARGGDALIQPVLDAVRRIDPKLLPPADLSAMTPQQHANLNAIYHAFSGDIRPVAGQAIVGEYTLPLVRDSLLGPVEAELVLTAQINGNLRYGGAWTGGSESLLHVSQGAGRSYGVTNAKRGYVGGAGGYSTSKEGFRQANIAIGGGGSYAGSRGVSSGVADASYHGTGTPQGDMHAYTADVDYTIDIRQTDRPWPTTTALGRTPIDGRTRTETAQPPANPAAPQNAAGQQQNAAGQQQPAAQPIHVPDGIVLAAPMDAVVPGLPDNRVGPGFGQDVEVTLRSGPPAAAPAPAAVGVDLRGQIDAYAVVDTRVPPELAHAADAVLAKEITGVRPPGPAGRRDRFGRRPRPPLPPPIRTGLGLFGGTWKSWQRGQITSSDGNVYSFKKSPLTQPGTQSKVAVDAFLGPVGRRGGEIFALDGTTDHARGLGEGGLLTDLHGDLKIETTYYNPRIVTQPRTATLYRINEAIRRPGAAKGRGTGWNLGLSGDFGGAKGPSRPDPKWLFGFSRNKTQQVSHDISSTVGGRLAHTGPTVVVEFDTRHELTGRPTASNLLPDFITGGRAKQASAVVSSPNGLYLRLPVDVANRIVQAARDAAAPPGNATPGNVPTGNTPTATAPTGNAPTGTAPTTNAPTTNAPTTNAPTGHSPVPRDVPFGSSLGSTKVTGHTLPAGFEAALDGQLQAAGASQPQRDRVVAAVTDQLTNRGKIGRLPELVSGGIRVQDVEPTATGDVVLTVQIGASLTNGQPAPPKDPGRGHTFISDLTVDGSGTSVTAGTSNAIRFGAAGDYSHENGPKGDPAKVDEWGTRTGGGVRLPAAVSHSWGHSQTTRTSDSLWQEAVVLDGLTATGYDVSYTADITLTTLPKTVIDLATVGASRLVHSGPTGPGPLPLGGGGRIELTVPNHLAGIDIIPAPANPAPANPAPANPPAANPAAPDATWQPRPAAPGPYAPANPNAAWTLPADGSWRVETVTGHDAVRATTMAMLSADKGVRTPGANGSPVPVTGNERPSRISTVGTASEAAVFEMTSNGGLKSGGRRMLLGESYGVTGMPRAGLFTDDIADVALSVRTAGPPRLVPGSATGTFSMESFGDASTTTVSKSWGSGNGIESGLNGAPTAHQTHPTGTTGTITEPTYNPGGGGTAGSGQGRQDGTTTGGAKVVQERVSGRSYLFDLDVDYYVDVKQYTENQIGTAARAGAGKVAGWFRDPPAAATGNPQVVRVRVPGGARIRVWEQTALEHGLITLHDIDTQNTRTAPPPPGLDTSPAPDGALLHHGDPGGWRPGRAAPGARSDTLHVGVPDTSVPPAPHPKAPAGPATGRPGVPARDVLGWVGGLPPDAHPGQVVLHQPETALGGPTAHEFADQLQAAVTVPNGHPVGAAAIVRDPDGATWAPIAQTVTHDGTRTGQDGYPGPAVSDARPVAGWTRGGALTPVPGQPHTYTLGGPHGPHVEIVPSGLWVRPAAAAPAADHRRGITAVPVQPSGPVLHVDGATDPQVRDLLLDLSDDLRGRALIGAGQGAPVPGGQWYAQHLDPHVNQPQSPLPRPGADRPDSAHTDTLRRTVTRTAATYQGAAGRHDAAVTGLHDAEQSLIDNANTLASHARSNPSRASWAAAHDAARAASPDNPNLVRPRQLVTDTRDAMDTARGEWGTAREDLRDQLDRTRGYYGNLAGQIPPVLNARNDRQHTWQTVAADLGPAAVQFGGTDHLGAAQGAVTAAQQALDDAQRQRDAAGTEITATDQAAAALDDAIDRAHPTGPSPLASTDTAPLAVSAAAMYQPQPVRAGTYLPPGVAAPDERALAGALPPWSGGPAVVVHGDGHGNAVVGGDVLSPAQLAGYLLAEGVLQPGTAGWLYVAGAAPDALGEALAQILPLAGWVPLAGPDAAAQRSVTLLAQQEGSLEALADAVGLPYLAGSAGTQGSRSWTRLRNRLTDLARQAIESGHPTPTVADLREVLQPAGTDLPAPGPGTSDPGTSDPGASGSGASDPGALDPSSSGAAGSGAQIP
jgi:hypothetical protein